MNKALLPTFLLLSYSSLALSAQAFDGFNIEAGVGLAATDAVDIWGSSEYYPGYSQGKTKLAVSFSKSVAEYCNLTASTFYMPGKHKIGYGSSSGTDPEGTDTPLWLDKTYGLVIEPGYYFEKDTLGYFKLGYARSTMKFNDKSRTIEYGDVAGLVYGLGLKHKINSNLYVGMEAQRIHFGQKVSVTSTAINVRTTPTTSYFGLNVGYAFSDIYHEPSMYRTSDFDGAYLQAALGMANYHVHTDWVNTSGYNDGMHKPQLILSGGYSQSFNNRLNLSVNAFSNLREERTNYKQYDELTLSETIWGLAIEPGYSLDESSIAYMKLGAATTTLKHSNNSSYGLEFGRIRGPLYGAGYKHTFKENFYVGMEGYRIAFGKSGMSLNPASSFGLGRAKLNYNFAGVTLGYTI